ncbi:MAG: hypothetical protein L0219_14950, partial [Phycisphaerales bacterium]|nr:hypothetical protein [Phycisphaerales bacterium]
MVVGLALLLHTPVLDPLRLSVDSQYRRLASGVAGAATFDYGTLRFDLGHAGHEKLQALRQLSAHPERAIIAEQVEAIGKIADPWSWKQQLREASAPKLTAEIFELRNASRRIPEGLLAKLDRLQEPERERC